MIGEVLNALAALPGALFTRMSGSGATCFALFPDDDGCQRGGGGAEARQYPTGGSQPPRCRISASTREDRGPRYRPYGPATGSNKRARRRNRRCPTSARVIVAGGQDRQRGLGGIGIGAGPAHGFLDGAGLLHQGDGAVEIGLGLVAGLDHPLPERARRFVGAGMGQDDGQGHLGFAEIVAHRSCPSAPGGRNNPAHRPPAGRRCRDFRHRRACPRRNRRRWPASTAPPSAAAANSAAVLADTTFR